MNKDQMNAFMKACRVLYYGRSRTGGAIDEAMTVEEEGLFHEVVDLYLDGVRDPRKREILCQRLGIRGFEKQSLKVIGSALGISGSRVGQLERKALPELFRQVHPKWRNIIWGEYAV